MLAKAGDLLIFSMRTWASCQRHDGGLRRAVFASHGLARRRMGFRDITSGRSMGRIRRCNDLLKKRSHGMREVLGFPPAGHAYWNAETIAAVKLRYPGMDVPAYEV